MHSAYQCILLLFKMYGVTANAGNARKFSANKIKDEL